MRALISLLLLCGCSSPAGTKFAEAKPETVIIDEWEYSLFRVENDVYVQVQPNSGALTFMPDDARARREAVSAIRQTYQWEIDAATVKHGTMAMTATLVC